MYLGEACDIELYCSLPLPTGATAQRNKQAALVAKKREGDTHTDLQCPPPLLSVQKRGKERQGEMFSCVLRCRSKWSVLQA